MAQCGVRRRMLPLLLAVSLLLAPRAGSHVRAQAQGQGQQEEGLEEQQQLQAEEAYRLDATLTRLCDADAQVSGARVAAIFGEHAWLGRAVRRVDEVFGECRHTATRRCVDLQREWGGTCGEVNDRVARAAKDAAREAGRRRETGRQGEQDGVAVLVIKHAELLLQGPHTLECASALFGFTDRGQDSGDRTDAVNADALRVIMLFEMEDSPHVARVQDNAFKTGLAWDELRGSDRNGDWQGALLRRWDSADMRHSAASLVGRLDGVVLRGSAPLPPPGIAVDSYVHEYACERPASSSLPGEDDSFAIDLAALLIADRRVLLLVLVFLILFLLRSPPDATVHATTRAPPAPKICRPNRERAGTPVSDSDTGSEAHSAARHRRTTRHGHVPNTRHTLRDGKKY